MSEIHSLRVESQDSSLLEKVNLEFVKEKLLWAREQSWKVFEEIKSELREGITEKDAFRIGMDACKRLGAAKQWHKPFTRFGPGTCLTFNDPLQVEYKLKTGDPVYIDLGPVWTDGSGLEYEGDIGDTFVFGKNPEAEKCANTAREIFRSAENKWKANQLSGKALYDFVRQETENRNYILVEGVEGHRLSDFPHQKYSRERLSKISFYPAPLLWVLEVQIRHPSLEIGAFYEDVLGAI